MSPCCQLCVVACHRQVELLEEFAGAVGAPLDLSASLAPREAAFLRDLRAELAY